MKRFLIFVFVFSLLFTTFVNNAYAKLLPFPLELYNFSQTGQRIERIVFTPVKKQSILKLTDEKYAQEIVYYFYKSGFNNPPVNYILFESGDFYIVNKNFLKSKIDTNLQVPVISIILVYENNLDLSKFDKSISNFASIELSTQIKNSNVINLESIQFREMAVIQEENHSRIEYSEELDGVQLRNLIKNIDLQNKYSYKLDLSIAEINNQIPPGVSIEQRIFIKNNSEAEVILGKNMIIQGRFEKDSIFYSNNNWQNLRTMFILSDGGIEINGTRTVISYIQTPLMPGTYTENLELYLNEEKVIFKPIKITVSDIGQKVLRIRPNAFGYLNVRAEASSSSAEISRAAAGAQFLFTEQKNGFYKIKIAEKEGWVLGSYVDVIKSK